MLAQKRISFFDVDLGLDSPYLYGLILLHVLLGVLVFFIESAAVVHVALCILAIVIISSRGNKTNTLIVAAYIVGAELLWRVTESNPLHELAKYAVAFAFLLCALRDKKLKIPQSMFLIGVFMFVAVPQPLFAYNFDYARQVLSFYLSAYVMLVVAGSVLYEHRLSQREITQVLLVTLLPIISLGVLLGLQLITNSNITWTTEANFEASGGFGPNQVATALALGANIIFWYLILLAKKLDIRKGLFLGAIAIVLTVQSALTFSRGGIYNLVIPIAVAAIHIVTKREIFRVVLIFAVIAMAVWVILPALDNFTGGKLIERFSSVNTSGRIDIVDASLSYFYANPFFGAGVGRLPAEADTITAHTEQIRLLGEHGLMGIFIYILMVVPTIRRYFQAKSLKQKALILSLFVWAQVYMFHSAVRTAAPIFLTVLTYMQLDFDDEA